MRKILYPALLLLCTNLAWADITVTGTKGMTSTCQDLVGRWLGSGDLSATIITPITCHYRGTANMYDLKSNGAFRVELSLHKESGSDLCSANEFLALGGMCTNNAITLKQPNAELQGSLSEEGRSMSLAGKIKLNIFGNPVYADIKNVNLKKQ